MNLIQDLADECVRDDCSYDPLPQHVVEFLSKIRDNPKYQAFLAEYLQDQGVWAIIAPEVLRGFNDDRDNAWHTIQRLTHAWATTVLSNEVDAYIDSKLGGYIPDGVEFKDEFGGAL